MTDPNRKCNCQSPRIGMCWGCGKPVFGDQPNAYADITFPGDLSTVENLKPIHDTPECISLCRERHAREYHNWRVSQGETAVKTFIV